MECICNVHVHTVVCRTYDMTYIYLLTLRYSCFYTDANKSPNATSKITPGHDAKLPVLHVFPFQPPSHQQTPGLMQSPWINPDINTP